MSVWSPNKITRVVSVLSNTSMQPVQVNTNDGLALIKYMGSRQGDIALVCEVIGAGIANIIGLNSPEYCVLECPEIELRELGKTTNQGPAFASKWCSQSISSSSGRALLENLSKPETIAKLVVFDTLVKNYDRFSEYSPDNFDNLLFVPDGRKTELLVIDNSHILIEEWQTDFDIDVADWPHEQVVFGNHPNFSTFLNHNTVGQALKVLAKVDKQALEPILDVVPSVWGVARSELDNLSECIVLRAELMQSWFEEEILGQAELDL